MQAGDANGEGDAMMKRPKESGTEGNAVVLERQYGPYQAKICFAAVECPNAPKNVLDAIMKAYCYRVEKDMSCM